MKSKMTPCNSSPRPLLCPEQQWSPNCRAERPPGRGWAGHQDQDSGSAANTINGLEIRAVKK